MKDSEEFIEFLEYSLGKETITRLENSFRRIKRNLDLISYTQNESRFLKFRQMHTIFGQRVLGYDYRCQSLIVEALHIEKITISVPWNEAFVEELLRVILQEIKESGD